MEMRRTERLVSDPEAIYAILKKCTTISLGMNGEGVPYVVPMTFGCSLENRVITVYFHSAQEGRKQELLAKNPHVCVEGHLYYATVRTQGGGITAKYESVIGTGIAEKLTERVEKIAAIRVMLDQYRESGFPAESCKGLDRCDVYRVRLEEVQGKHNLEKD